MSLFKLSVGALAIKPKVWIDDQDHLCARSALLAQLTTLFAHSRHLLIDAKAQTVSIWGRWFWLLPYGRDIAFDRIHYLDYTHDSQAREWAGPHWDASDQFEWYTVRLVLKDPYEKVKLFTFGGEGSVVRGWEGVFWGDSMVDLAGDQDQSSRGFIDLLRGITGKPVGAPVKHIPDAGGEFFQCSACQRPSPPNLAKCQYCGGAIERATR